MKLCIDGLLRTSVDDIDDHFIEMELSSERGKVCGNQISILHNEEFQLAAHTYVRSKGSQISPQKCFANGSTTALVWISVLKRHTDGLIIWV